MKNFNNTYNRDHQKKRFNDREGPKMFEAICSECGRKCQLPFKPSSDKPVYCSECFENRGGGSKPRFQDKRMFEAVCNNCGKRFELPFRPTRDKPVYCNDCFDRGKNSSNRNITNEQFDILNDKLNKILQLLSPAKEEKIVKPKKTPIKKKKAKK